MNNLNEAFQFEWNLKFNSRKNSSILHLWCTCKIMWKITNFSIGIPYQSIRALYFNCFIIDTFIKWSQIEWGRVNIAPSKHVEFSRGLRVVVVLIVVVLVVKVGTVLVGTVLVVVMGVVQVGTGGAVGVSHGSVVKAGSSTQSTCSGKSHRPMFELYNNVLGQDRRTQNPTRHT